MLDGAARERGRFERRLNDVELLLLFPNGSVELRSVVELVNGMPIPAKPGGDVPPQNSLGLPGHGTSHMPFATALASPSMSAQ
jgi:hypothetical protein